MRRWLARILIAVALALATPFFILFGWLSDKIGRKPIIMAGLAGGLDPALKVAAKYPKVTFLHEGGLKTAPNLGTFFGTIWQAEYLSGIAAGRSSCELKSQYGHLLTHHGKCR